MRISQDLEVCESPKEFQAVLTKHFDENPFRVVSRRCSKNPVEYIDITATLDTETTNTAEDGFVYSFQMNVDGVNCTVRYVEDFLEIIEMLMNEFTLCQKCRLVFYVHNLGYEHYYLSQICKHFWGEPKTLFTKSTKALSIRYENGIEFRDSLKLFQKSLAGATKGLPHAKLKGDLDFSVYRTPDTELNQQEYDYTVNDVQGLWEAIERLKKEHGYNASTIPYTNTGMVKEAVKAELRKDRSGKIWKQMTELALDKAQLNLAYNCMAGGDTHGTRWRAGETYENCNSYDLKSAHPSQQILRKFPSGKPFWFEGSLEELNMMTDTGNYGWIGCLKITDVHCKYDAPDPTLSLSKCLTTERLGALDNGRVLDADMVVCYMDSNDLWRFRHSYDYQQIELVGILMFKLAYLPDVFRNAVLDFFRIKEGAEDGPERVFAKICVNTIFGACAQKTIRDEYVVEFDDEGIEYTPTKWEVNLAKKDDEEVLASQKNGLPFLWGLWTASMSRLALYKLQMAVGWDNLIYWDTDSVKYQGEKMDSVELYNAEVREACLDRNAVVQNRKNKDVYIGVAEDEHPEVPYGYKRFRFLHAKCYAAESWNGSEYVVETTIAGVSKKNGVEAMAGDIDNLADGLYIADAGGQKLAYHSKPITVRTDWARKTMTASYIYMTPRDYLVNAGIPDRIMEYDTEILAE